MICALSFCQNDRPMALELARHIECLGGVSKHYCHIFHPDDVESGDIFDCLQRAFGRVTGHRYRETLKGWPDGPNQCFLEAARCIELLPGRDPWFWMEADCVPTHSKWLDDIEAEYRYCGKTILGVINKTFDASGKANGEHVTGVAVYPHDFLSQCPPLKSIVNATAEYRRSAHCPPAFDCYIAPYTVHNCAKSHTIKHYWKSYDFVEYNGQIVCKFRKNYGASNIVDLNAAVIHGAKDFSLLDILQRRLANPLTSTIPVIMKENACSRH
jgi:hypothetical protein